MTKATAIKTGSGRPLYLSISADGDRVEELEALDTRFQAMPRAVMVYEQFVCAPSAKVDAERILTFDDVRCARELRRLAPRVRASDVLVGNIELGHPAYGPKYAAACERFASLLRAGAAMGLGVGGPAVCQGSGSYGLIKANQTVSGTTVWHAKHPAAPMVEMDLAAKPIIDQDSHVVCELYLTYPSAPDGGPRQNSRVRAFEQTAWVRRDLARTAYLAQGKPILAFVNPFYRGNHDRTGKPVSSSDLKLLIREIAAVDRACPVVWMHVGKGNSTPHAAADAAERWELAWRERGPR